MNLRDLEYLSALYQMRHFRKAAEMCNVSQPTLSGQISKLEDELELSLIERNTRNVMFTPAGEAVVKHARTVLEEVRQLRDAAQVYKDPMAGELRIGLIPTVAPYLLPRIMPALFESFPRLQWRLEEKQTHQLMDQLKIGALDAVILAWLPDMEGYGKLSLYDEPLWLAAHKENPIINQDHITLADLDDQEVLMLEDGHCLRDQALGYCFSAGAREDATFQATSLETLRHMVAAGRGITLLPLLSVPEQFDSNLIRYRAFEMPQPTREIALVYRRGTSRIRSLHALGDVIKNQIACTFKDVG